MTVSRIIHYYEALLATLAILIWHGWHTIFHPDEYPMSTTWLTGYITEEEATHKYNDAALETMMRHRDAAGSPANEGNEAKP